ncbi:MAG: hypothetical protein U9N77_02480 [Thermodesulfobacteriota bacterium]|nr:hypothetical protein [Thermodesulfobacteriota bacterium]
MQGLRRGMVTRIPEDFGKFIKFPLITNSQVVRPHDKRRDAYEKMEIRSSEKEL